MSIKDNVMGSGASAGLAGAIIGGVETGVSGAGTTSADAALLRLVSNHNIQTAANNSGVIIPPGNGTGRGLQIGDQMRIYNGSANTLLLYPPPLGKLNDGVATTGTVSCAAKTSLEITMLGATLYSVSGPST